MKEHIGQDWPLLAFVKGMGWRGGGWTVGSVLCCGSVVSGDCCGCFGVGDLFVKVCFGKITPEGGSPSRNSPEDKPTGGGLEIVFNQQ